MNEAIKAVKFSRSAKLSYQDGKIVNMDVVHNDDMKFVIMALMRAPNCPNTPLRRSGHLRVGWRGRDWLRRKRTSHQSR